MANRMVTVRRAATQFGLKEKTIRRWLALRKIEYIKIGGAVRISQSEITRIIENGTVSRTLGNERGFETEASGGSR
jgi:excisionase family DNA binding protein